MPFPAAFDAVLKEEMRKTEFAINSSLDMIIEIMQDEDDSMKERARLLRKLKFFGHGDFVDKNRRLRDEHLDVKGATPTEVLKEIEELCDAFALDPSSVSLEQKLFSEECAKYLAIFGKHQKKKDDEKEGNDDNDEDDEKLWLNISPRIELKVFRDGGVNGVVKRVYIPLDSEECADPEFGPRIVIEKNMVNTDLGPIRERKDFKEHERRGSGTTVTLWTNISTSEKYRTGKYTPPPKNIIRRTMFGMGDNMHSCIRIDEPNRGQHLLPQRPGTPFPPGESWIEPEPINDLHSLFPDHECKDHKNLISPSLSVYFDKKDSKYKPLIGKDIACHGKQLDNHSDYIKKPKIKHEGSQEPPAAKGTNSHNKYFLCKRTKEAADDSYTLYLPYGPHREILGKVRKKTNKYQALGDDRTPPGYFPYVRDPRPTRKGWIEEGMDEDETEAEHDHDDGDDCGDDPLHSDGNSKGKKPRVPPERQSAERSTQMTRATSNFNSLKQRTSRNRSTTQARGSQQAPPKIKNGHSPRGQPAIKSMYGLRTRHPAASSLKTGSHQVDQPRKGSVVTLARKEERASRNPATPSSTYAPILPPGYFKTTSPAHESMMDEGIIDRPSQLSDINTILPTAATHGASSTNQLAGKRSGRETRVVYRKEELDNRQAVASSRARSSGSGRSSSALG